MSQLFSTFGVDWKLLISQMVNFGIILFVLKRYAYGPVLGMLQKRKEIIERGLDDASKAEKSLKEATLNAEEISKVAKTNANAIIAEAQSEASQYVNKAKYDALTEKGKIISSAQAEIESQRQKNERLVKEKAVEHIVSSIKTILGSEVDENMNSRIIRKLTSNS